MSELGGNYVDFFGGLAVGAIAGACLGILVAALCGIRHQEELDRTYREERRASWDSGYAAGYHDGARKAVRRVG